jgi:hypothetical protein
MRPDVRLWAVSANLYQAKSYLLSHAELRFYMALCRAVPRAVSIAPKVRLADVVACAERKPSVFTFGRISQKHLDFVLFHAATSRILTAVELDDASHERELTQRRDAFVNELLSQVGMPLIRVQAIRTYSISVLRHQLDVGLPRRHRRRYAKRSSFRTHSMTGRCSGATGRM